MLQHYLDNAATTQPCAAAVQAALQVMNETYGNPSSTHTLGRNAKALLEQCRQDVATALGAASTGEIVFTSGGSESDNWAILSSARLMKHQGRHIISSQAEHDAIRQPLELLKKDGFEITMLRPDKTGAISPEAVLEALREDTVLISLMMVNNETGAVTDIRGIADAVRHAGSAAILHTDAVQGFKKIPFSARKLGADLISISGHKIHAVKGIGALYIRNGVRLPSMIVGGSQESGHRAGTEPLPQIAAFAAACREDANIQHMLEMKSLTLKMLQEAVPELRYLATDAPHILNVSMPGWRSEVLMNFLESRQVYVSRSSACKQGKRSHVLEAIGMPSDMIDGALRISFSRYTAPEDIAALAEGLHEARGLAHR